MPDYVRPKPMEPLEEAYVGDNIPYRGIEQHGVENPNKYTAPPGYGDTIAVPVQEEEPQQEAVPVFIVNESAREVREWNNNWIFLQTDTAAGIPSRTTQLAGMDIKRTKMTIVNQGPDTVYIGRMQEVTPSTGFPLAINATQVIEAQTAVYAVVPDTDSARVGILWEFSEVLPNR